MGNLALIDFVQILLITTLVYLAYIDLRTFRLPDLLTIPMIFFGLCCNAFTSTQLTNLQNAIIGSILGYFLLWLANFFYRLTKRQDGIGMGDAKLLAALGAWFGWHAIPGILFIASISGLVGGLFWLYWNKKGLKMAFPFGPFLAFAGIIEVLWPQLLQNLLLSNSV